KPQNDLSHKGQAVEEWADLHFFRPIGIRIARALQPTGISADQVTLWSLVIGLVAGHLFAYQDRWTNVIGFVLFIVSDIFDSADGQLARLRGRSTRFGRALDGISDNLRFVNLYFHLIYRLIHAGFWGPGAFLLVAAAGLAHTFQSAAIDFVRNAFLYIGVGNGGELDLPEDLAGGPQTTVLQRFGARVYRDYVQRQSHLFPRTVKLIRLLRRHGVKIGRASCRGRGEGQEGGVASRRRHTRSTRDWSSDVCSSDLLPVHRCRERRRAGSPGGSRGRAPNDRPAALRCARVPRLRAATVAPVPANGEAHPPAATSWRHRRVPRRVPRAPGGRAAVVRLVG